MALSASTVLFFILSCGLWVVEGRKFNSILTVPNGGKWGQWGHPEFCFQGYAIGFVVKVEPYGKGYDSTGMNGIAMFCDDGSSVSSTIGPWGIWHDVLYCDKSKLIAFALRVQEEITGDNTAANNIKFLCSDNTILTGTGIQKGRFGPMSNRCLIGSICGIQTRVQSALHTNDDTALNDVRMFCCN